MTKLGAILDYAKKRSLIWGRFDALSERASSVLFRVVTLRSLYQTLSDNTFFLSKTSTTETEGLVPGATRYKYFLSTSRNPGNAFRDSSSPHNPCLVLDGDLLNSHYSSYPVNYDDAVRRDVDADWPSNRGKGSSEMEDRVYSNKPSIPRACSYIQEVHIFPAPNMDKTDIQNLHVAVHNRGIELYVYGSAADSRSLNRSKALSQSQLAHWWMRKQNERCLKMTKLGQILNELAWLPKPFLTSLEWAVAKALVNNPDLQNHIPEADFSPIEITTTQDRLDNETVNKYSAEGRTSGGLAFRRHGYLYLWDGHHRYQAAIKNNQSKFRVRVFQMTDPDTLNGGGQSGMTLRQFCAQLHCTKDDILAAMDSHDRAHFDGEEKHKWQIY